MTFHLTLQCDVLRVEYNFNSQAGTLYLEDHSCRDMIGCINFFRSIDPEVKQIITFSGDREDTGYTRTTDDKWWSYHKRLGGRSEPFALPIKKAIG